MRQRVEDEVRRCVELVVTNCEAAASDLNGKVKACRLTALCEDILGWAYTSFC